MNADQPSPALIFDTLNAYQKTAALKAAIDLNLFSHIGEAGATAPEVAQRAAIADKGARVLCDYLTVLGFLIKSGERYSLTRDSAVFLTRNSPAYAGGTSEFLLSAHLRGCFEDLTSSVRKGGVAADARATVAPEHPVWESFARSMGPLMFPAAQGLAELLPLESGRATKVLDISASHGIWGIAFAQRYANAQLVALDWSNVLKIARENAARFGIADRFSTIEGSAFDVDLGTGYDVVLVPNFLHHFSEADCTAFLTKVHRALRPGGAVAIVEFVPNPDRVSPPPAAGFALVMLATTPEGDAYTFEEYAAMLQRAGFHAPKAHSLPASMSVAVIAHKAR